MAQLTSAAGVVEIGNERSGERLAVEPRLGQDVTGAGVSEHPVVENDVATRRLVRRLLAPPRYGTDAMSGVLESAYHVQPVVWDGVDRISTKSLILFLHWRWLSRAKTVRKCKEVVTGSEPLPRGLTMSSHRAYEELIDFIAAGTTPRNLVAFQPSEEARQRVADLIEREKSASITSQEKSELEHYVQLEHLMRMAKARARRHLSHG